MKKKIVKGFTFYIDYPAGGKIDSYVLDPADSLVWETICKNMPRGRYLKHIVSRRWEEDKTKPLYQDTHWGLYENKPFGEPKPVGNLYWDLTIYYE